MKKIVRMPYPSFKKKVISKAENKAKESYREVLKLLSNPANFHNSDNQGHEERIRRFRLTLKRVFGTFSLDSYYDYTTAFRRCFIDSSEECILCDSIDLNHIQSIDESAKSKLDSLLNDIDEYSFLVLERVL